VKASSSFFEKKEPKKLFSMGANFAANECQMDKSVLLLFFKKEDACLNPLPRSAA
jgi:hypothetical protein